MGAFPAMTANKREFWTAAWQGFRPDALAAAIDFGRYLVLWATVLGAHIVRSVMSIFGIEPELISVVTWIERYVFLSSFGAFFFRFLLRLYHNVRENLREEPIL